MAELADALDLGSSGATRTGSIPATRTKIMKFPPINGGFFVEYLLKIFAIVKLWILPLWCRFYAWTTITTTKQKWK